MGDEVEQCELRIRIAAIVPGDSGEIAVTFDTELNDPSLTLVEWQEDRFVPFVQRQAGGGLDVVAGADRRGLSSGIFFGPMHEPGDELQRQNLRLRPPARRSGSAGLLRPADSRRGR